MSFEARNETEVTKGSQRCPKGKLHEPTARENYTQYLKFVLKHDINVLETGLVIQPNLSWLAASPDGLVSDHSDSIRVGLTGIQN